MFYSSVAVIAARAEVNHGFLAQRVVAVSAVMDLVLHLFDAEGDEAAACVETNASQADARQPLSMRATSTHHRLPTVLAHRAKH